MGIFKKLFGSKVEEQETNNTAPPKPEPEPEPEPEPIEITEISAEALKSRIDSDDNDFIIVDMRQSYEYEAGHIPGAIHMFIQEIPMRINELPKDTDIIFQCWHGNTSLGAAGYLIQNGWNASRVVSLSGGITGWVQTHGIEALVKN